MSSSTPDSFRAAVLTVSDSCARGERNDLSGPAVARALQDHHFVVVETRVVADEHAAIQKAIFDLARRVRLVVTTGGTGISTRDVTPEATRSVCGRMLDGVAVIFHLDGGLAGQLFQQIQIDRRLSEGLQRRLLLQPEGRRPAEDVLRDAGKAEAGEADV